MAICSPVNRLFLTGLPPSPSGAGGTAYQLFRESLWSKIRGYPPN